MDEMTNRTARLEEYENRLREMRHSLVCQLMAQPHARPDHAIAIASDLMHFVETGEREPQAATAKTGEREPRTPETAEEKAKALGMYRIPGVPGWHGHGQMQQVVASPQTPDIADIEYRMEVRRRMEYDTSTGRWVVKNATVEVTGNGDLLRLVLDPS